MAKTNDQIEYELNMAWFNDYRPKHTDVIRPDFGTLNEDDIADWRNYVPGVVRAAWSQLDDIAKLCVAITAQDAADATVDR